MPPLEVLETQQQPLAFVLPRKGPLDTLPSGMDRLVEKPLATSLRGLAVAWVFFDVWDHPCMEDRLAIRLGIAPAIPIELGAFERQTRRFGHPLQGLQAFGYQHRIRFIDGCDREGNSHITVVVDDGDNFLALLVLVAGIPHAIPAFFGYRIGPITMQDAEIEVVVIRQMLHTGDTCLLSGAIVRPSGEDLVHRRRVDSRLAVTLFGYGQALPLHASVEHPHNEVEDTMLAQFALGSPLGHREVRQDKWRELRGGELDRNRRRCWFCWRCRHDELASCEDR